MKQKVLLLYEDTKERCKYAALMESAGYEVVLTSTRKGAIKVIDDGPPDMAVLDAELPGWDDERITHQLSKRSIPILIITKRGEYSIGRRLQDMALIRRFLYKPFFSSSLLKGIGDALGR